MPRLNVAVQRSPGARQNTHGCPGAYPSGSSRPAVHEDRPSTRSSHAPLIQIKERVRSLVQAFHFPLQALPLPSAHPWLDPRFIGFAFRMNISDLICRHLSKYVITGLHGTQLTTLLCWSPFEDTGECFDGSQVFQTGRATRLGALGEGGGGVNIGPPCLCSDWLESKTKLHIKHVFTWRLDTAPM